MFLIGGLVKEPGRDRIEALTNRDDEIRQHSHTSNEVKFFYLASGSGCSSWRCSGKSWSIKLSYTRGKKDTIFA
ncbi:hypothetical protein Vadar_018116 [Vaccinium darrowii]|uniref:Uncharacterized protein n=1 Tax=Vaccinium darrowii TaxID=229202 RepID=A0ACB7XIC4_9ERIC|nr:hypothetical protein Vadar_018116 [Vaccinium darrowii]